MGDPAFKLSITPIADAIWRTHPASGAEFKIAPLTGERDQAFVDQSTTVLGQVDQIAYGRLVAAECIKDWRGLGTKQAGAQPCTPENVQTFVTNHGRTIMPWVTMEARSLDHFREAEVEEAKKD